MDCFHGLAMARVHSSSFGDVLLAEHTVAPENIIEDCLEDPRGWYTSYDYRPAFHKRTIEEDDLRYVL